jgi:hypothetical protein
MLRPLGALSLLPDCHEHVGDARSAALLNDVQAVLRAAVGPVDWGDALRPVDIGLQAMDASRARAIDRILRSSVPERLVWFGDAEYDYRRAAEGWSPAAPHEPAGGAGDARPARLPPELPRRAPPAVCPRLPALLDPRAAGGRAGRVTQGQHYPRYESRSTVTA